MGAIRAKNLLKKTRPSGVANPGYYLYIFYSHYILSHDHSKRLCHLLPAKRQKSLIGWL
jgi:hypothetical protein